jgi:tetratricopeptide (TPR) repeat protein
LFRCYDRRVLRDHSQHRTAALKRETGGSYTRREVCRLLKIDGRQLRSWERQQLIPELSEYRFSDLLGLKTVIRLRNDQIHPRVIKQTLHALKERLKDLPHLSEDVRVYKEGRRVRVQIGKQKMEPVSGQLLFDFAEHEINKLLQLPASRTGAEGVAESVRKKLEADRWFECGLELERRGAPYQQIIEAYEKAAELDPHSAGALVNLGTVFFNGHAWADAERYYKKALEIDPNYPLAHFNLGNLYDERGDTTTALLHYEAALKISPSYADAHYNVALLYQSLGDVMEAVRHWRAYIKLDGNSNWGQIAKRELAKLEAMTVVPGMRPGSSKMHLVKSDKA